MLNLALKAGEPWNEMVRFYRVLSNDRQQEFTDLGSRMRNDYTQKQQKQAAPPGTPIEVDSALQKQAVALFESNFDLTKGKYQMFLAAYCGSTEPDALCGFRFELNAGNLQAMRAESFQGYNYGAGVWYPNNQPASMIWPNLERLPDDTGREAFKRIAIEPVS